MEGSNGLYTTIRVKYPPWSWPNLEIEYYSEDNGNQTVSNYTVRFEGDEGSIILTDIKREDMNKEMQKEIDIQYRILKEKQ